VRIDPRTDKPLEKPLLIWADPLFVAVGDGEVWIKNSEGGNLAREAVAGRQGNRDPGPGPRSHEGGSYVCRPMVNRLQEINLPLGLSASCCPVDRSWLRI